MCMLGSLGDLDQSKCQAASGCKASMLPRNSREQSMDGLSNTNQQLRMPEICMGSLWLIGVGTYKSSSAHVPVLE